LLYSLNLNDYKWMQMYALYCKPAVVMTASFTICVCFLVATMFLRKLLNKNDAKPEQKTTPPPGMQTMGASLQKRFARGVQYNSKYANEICN